MEDLNTLKEQSRWSGKRVVLMYWMGLLFLGTGVAVGLGTQVLSPNVQFGPKAYIHTPETGPFTSADCTEGSCHTVEGDAWNATAHSA